MESLCTSFTVCSLTSLEKFLCFSSCPSRLDFDDFFCPVGPFKGFSSGLGSQGRHTDTSPLYDLPLSIPKYIVKVHP